ncbi:formate/nitrite transporter family protein [Cohnella silvisoli]|uniref:Formate/nitrite transporter family protein n=1 Tax=Cohnella silvisoli TaxID=2873699 RepID=A0ABV1KLI8_9BACL|nr:formate/nitrite transporter family protein [Cohnella silvisoli]MCD9020684.1 formate/nitrite transporter family protein [Cohnella silvisoli]
MYRDTLEKFTESAADKKSRLDASLSRYLLSSGLAGAYVGMAVVLMFSVSAPLYSVHSPWTSWSMGASFGIALLLVVFGGADLFTGNHMTYTIGTFAGTTSWKDAIKNWFWCWIGNFLGAAIFAWIVSRTGLFSAIPPEHQLMAVAAKKMHLPFEQLFYRGVLCNWLVCLALWCSARVRNEAAKILLIGWCLLAFVASGFEHSVANMTTLTLALLEPHPDIVTLQGLVNNLIPVSLGNIVGGAAFVGMAYWFLAAEKIRVPR